MNNELNELIEKLVEFAKVAKKEVDKIVQKGDLTPAELDSVYKVACVTEKIQSMIGDPMQSYGMYGRMPDPYVATYDGMSGTRMRSPVTGRYISRGSDMHNGYSGHSIEDRMIAMLEQQMDSAKSDYERQKIQEEIAHIRMSMR